MLMIDFGLELGWVKEPIQSWICTEHEVTQLGILTPTWFIFGGIPIAVTTKKAGEAIFKDFEPERRMNAN